MTENKLDRLRVPIEKLSSSCDPSVFSFQTTADVPPLKGIVGQERAVRAVEFGLRVKGPGYNLYLAGVPGTGKTTYAESMARQVAAEQPVPNDWVYVYNFRDPDSPQAIELPPGQGHRFRQDMENMLQELRESLPKVFESEEYEAGRKALLEQLEEARDKAVAALAESAKQVGFLLRHAPNGFVLVPVGEDGKPMTSEEINALSDKRRESLEQQSRLLQDQTSEMARRVRVVEKETAKMLLEHEQTTALGLIEPLLNQLRKNYESVPGAPKLSYYWSELQADILRHLADFRRSTGERQTEAGLKQKTPNRPADFTRYAVNVIIDNSETEGAPVVLETLPVYYHLVGKQEYTGQATGAGTDLTMIKPGALHRANGGYLILQVQDVLNNPPSWDALKRALKTNQIHLEALGDQYRMFPVRTMRPEPIPLQVKVILIGTPRLFAMLQYIDEDFRKLFKIQAEFDTQMERTPETMQQYAMFISTLCNREDLPPFDRTAVAKIIDYASRLTGDQKKVTTRFNELVEVIYEAAAWVRGGSEEETVVTAAEVEKALTEREFRHNLGEQKLQELFDRDTIRVDTEGMAVGQINGLSVLGFGGQQFGRPSRITARTYMGHKGVVHIEREAQMSGRIHDKGVMILSGYLGAKYAQKIPLALNASITFEQLYGEVDGDSASSTELYALLSSLANVPLRQDLAVTGSVDQYGRVQPIGGVNEKIEGFYAVCKARGLTGTQGVVIPVQNVDNLMLRSEVIEAVQSGKFHIYAVSTIDEGLALFTGMEPGESDEKGNYPPETVHGKVQMRLTQYAAGLASFQRGELQV